MGMAIIIAGFIMFGTGFVLYYSIEVGQTDPVMRYIKNIGTFVGLSGIGVIIAGILTHLINRNELSIAENFDV